jgi:uncharacterized repeat protein (TIGR01451 family)
MQNWNRFPRALLVLSLLIVLCAGLFAPRVDVVEAKPLGAADDLLLTMTVPAADLFPNIGDTVTFTIKVKNIDLTVVTGVTVKDILPAGLIYKSDDGSGTYDNNTGIWGVGSLDAGITAQLKITATVTLTGPKINNAAIWASDQVDPDIVNNQASVTINPLISDLSITKTVNNAAPNRDDIIIFTILVSNAGPDPAINVTIKDLLPSGVMYISDDSGGSYNNSTGFWAVGSLLASGLGSSDTLNITAKATVSGAKTNSAEVWTSDQYDPDSTVGNSVTTEDDYASVNITPKVADISITKTINNVAPNTGDSVKFTITVINAGLDTATGITVKDLLSSDFTYSSDSGGGTYNSTTGIWTVGTLVNGASAILTIDATATTSGIKTNWAEVWTSDQLDPDSTPGDNSKITDDDDGAPSADLSITKTADATTLIVGANVVFTIIVSNTGPARATGVIVKDALPSGLVYVTDNGNGTYNSGTGLWSVGSLANGANATLTITANAPATSSSTNWAEVWNSDQIDPDSTPGDVSTTADDDASVTVNASVPVSSVIINEVAWAGTISGLSDDEWIELYNPGSASVNISGWNLKAADGDPNIVIPNGISIPAGGYYLLERDDNNTVSDIPADLLYTGTLSNSGEVLTLYDGSLKIIDTANGNGGSWPAGSSSTYGTMERSGTSAESDSVWHTNTGIKRNGKNANNGDILGTPKSSNSPTPTPTPTPEKTDTPTPVPTFRPPDPRPIINEILPRPGFDWNKDGKVDVFDEFIEIKNLTSIDISLNGWKLDDEANLGSNPFTLPDVTLKPGQRIVFYALETNILLSDGGDTARLLDPNGKIYDAYTYSIAKAEDQSICRLPDGNVYNGWFEDCIPTPNLTNSREGAVPVMPDEGYQSPVCQLPDTLPADFLFAECRGYGANIWNADYWNQPHTSASRYIPQNTSKWEAIIE